MDQTKVRSKVRKKEKISIFVSFAGIETIRANPLFIFVGRGGGLVGEDSIVNGNSFGDVRGEPSRSVDDGDDNDASKGSKRKLLA